MKKLTILAALAALFLASGCARKYQGPPTVITAYSGADVVVINYIYVVADVPKQIDATGELDLDPFPVP